MVREDLSPSQRAVQAAHAVLEASRQGLIPSYIPHPSLVLCTRPDELSLLSKAEELVQSGISFVLFREPDIGNQATALATAPLSKADRRLFRSLPLLKL